eukprot:3054255-Pyramimonas_sp.AAC.1
MWRLQCGHQCHAECWGRNARGRVSRGRAVADVAVHVPSAGGQASSWRNAHMRDISTHRAQQ